MAEIEALILLADIKGYSQKKTLERMTTLKNKLPLIFYEIKQNGYLPHIAFYNSWGDAFLIVFEVNHKAENTNHTLCVEACIETAFILRDRIKNYFNWEIRCALHAGFAYKDLYQNLFPFKQKLNVIGQDIDLPSRIEPIVPAGRVWGTEEFYNLAKSNTKITFQPLGKRMLAKGWGKRNLYDIRVSNEIPLSISRIRISDFLNSCKKHFFLTLSTGLTFILLFLLFSVHQTNNIRAYEKILKIGSNIMINNEEVDKSDNIQSVVDYLTNQMNLPSDQETSPLSKTKNGRDKIQYTRDSKYETYNDIGLFQIRKGNYELAEKMLKISLKIDSKRWESYYNLALLYLKKNGVSNNQDVIAKYLAKSKENGMPIEFLVADDEFAVIKKLDFYKEIIQN